MNIFKVLYWGFTANEAKKKLDRAIGNMGKYQVLSVKPNVDYYADKVWEVKFKSDIDNYPNVWVERVN